MFLEEAFCKQDWLATTAFGLSGFVCCVHVLREEHDRMGIYTKVNVSLLLKKKKKIQKESSFGVKLIVKGGIKEFVYKFWVISSQEKGNWIYVIGHIGHTVQISDCDSLEENFISKLFAEEYPDIGVCLDKK